MGSQIGSLHVRRSILIEALPARVWEEFGSLERFRAWFGIGHTLHAFEPRVGAHVDLSVDIGGTAEHFGGPVVLLEPERELTFESNWASPSRALPVPTFFTLRLTPAYGGTLAEIFHHGFERLGTDAADGLQSYEEGWDVKHLKALRAVVAG